MSSRLAGCFTVDDMKLYPYLASLQDSENIFIEPSACAAFEGLICIAENDGESYMPPDENSVHIVWATGGNMVPEKEKKEYYEKGTMLMKRQEVNCE